MASGERQGAAHAHGNNAFRKRVHEITVVNHNLEAVLFLEPPLRNNKVRWVNEGLTRLETN